MVTQQLGVGPFTLELLNSNRGLTIASSNDAEASLAILLDAAANPQDPKFLDAIRARREEGNGDLWIRPGHEPQTAVVWTAGCDRPVEIRWDHLHSAATDLLARRLAWEPPPGHWLFRPDPTGPLPSQVDIDALLALDPQAVAVDELDFDATVGQESNGLIEARRTLLEQCDSLALFDLHRFVSDTGDARLHALDNFQFRTLHALRTAALTLRSWHVVEADQSVLDGPITLDYVRHKLWPPGEDGFEWFQRVSALVPVTSAQDQEVITQRVAGRIVTVAWRRDGSRPALLGISLD